MRYRPLLPAFAGAAVGFAAAGFLIGDSENSDVYAPAFHANNETSRVTEEQPRSTQAVAPGRSEQVDADLSSDLTPEELDAAIRSHARQLRIEALLAAGFTMERIDWLQTRAKELRLLRDKKAFERKQQGLPYQSKAAYLTDPDLDLRYEIGDDEYERYRIALGRPVGVTIDEILPGSDAERAGLQPNDVIVGYGGKRIFNIGELYQLASETDSRRSALLDVRRNGNPMQVAMPAALLGITVAPPWVGLPDTTIFEAQDHAEHNHP